MTISNLKDLEAVIRLCRKQGVDSIEVDGVKLQLGSAPPKQAKSAGTETSIESDDVYTDEQLLTWSAHG